MAGKKELIRLDAVILDVLDETAFTAELENGFQFVAFYSGTARADLAGRTAPGDRVTAEFSPYEMSIGRIVCPSERS